MLAEASEIEKVSSGVTAEWGLKKVDGGWIKTRNSFARVQLFIYAGHIHKLLPIDRNKVIARRSRLPGGPPEALVG